jgi:predicted AAA+ superfamily ATPase
MITRLPAFSASQDRVAAQGKKLYFYDTGIANTLSRLSEGAAYENTLFNQLRPFGKLSYLSKGSQVEIDFILENPAGEATAMEAKTHPTPDEERRLIRLAERLGLGRAYLVGRYPTPDFTRFLWAGSIH